MYLQILVVFQSGQTIRTDRTEMTEEQVKELWATVSSALTENEGSLSCRVNSYSTAINLSSVNYVTFVYDSDEDDEE